MAGAGVVRGGGGGVDNVLLVSVLALCVGVVLVSVFALCVVLVSVFALCVFALCVVLVSGIGYWVSGVGDNVTGGRVVGRGGVGGIGN